MTEAYICDAVRTPIGRYGGALASIRADDLAAMPIRELMSRNPAVDWGALDDVLLGCANQSGEDNRNVARMAALLAGLGEQAPGLTINRLCASGLDAVTAAARTIKAGEAELIIAGGVESMSRAPFVMGKAEAAYARAMTLEDTTMGWRFVNPRMAECFGVDPMPQTAEAVASHYGVSRQDQDAFACRSQARAAQAQRSGRLAGEIMAVTIPRPKAADILFAADEHPRLSSLEALAALKPVVTPTGTVTAGNASGINDGAAALLIASDAAIAKYGLRPRARVRAGAATGVAPRLMGIGPVSASRKALALAGLDIGQIDVVELNEAFASQALACLRELGLPDDGDHINPNGGAIALGHPLGMSGARLALTATQQLAETGGRFALVTMCVGVGQGVALILERV